VREARQTLILDALGGGNKQSISVYKDKMVKTKSMDVSKNNQAKQKQTFLSMTV